MPRSPACRGVLKDDFPTLAAQKAGLRSAPREGELLFTMLLQDFEVRLTPAPLPAENRTAGASFLP